MLIVIFCPVEVQTPEIAHYVILGGPMEASIVTLKEKGYKLLWMDRFVAKPMTEIEPYFQVLTGGYDNGQSIGLSNDTIDEIRSINIWARPNIRATCDECGMPLEPVQASQEAKFQRLMQTHHYLGSLPKIGNTI